MNRNFAIVAMLVAVIGCLTVVSYLWRTSRLSQSRERAIFQTSKGVYPQPLKSGISALNYSVMPTTHEANEGKRPSSVLLDMGVAVTGGEETQALKNEKMVSRLLKTLQWFGSAKNELSDFIASIEAGTLSVDDNNGLWQSIAESSNTTVCATYSSKDGPISTFKKRVYGDEERTNAVLDASYVLQFDKEGHIKSFRRYGPETRLDFFANGHLRCFGAKSKEGYQYLAYWDEEGNVRREGTSRGKIGEMKNGKYIKHPNHPDFDKPEKTGT